MTARATRGRTAAAWTLAAAVLFLALPAAAFEPEPLPESIAWRREQPTSLALHPLAALRDGPLARSEAEWTPLYSSRDGARVEGGRRSLALRTSGAPWRAGVELESCIATARGGDGAPWIGGERAGSTRAAAGLAAESSRFGIAGAALCDHHRWGAAAEARAPLGQGARASVSWSLAPQAGRIAVRWDEADVLAAGRWLDQRVSWRIDVPIAGGALALGQHALDRRANGAFDPAVRDRFEPSLAWRASLLDLTLDRRGARWSGSLRYGEGRQSARLWRGNAPYATAAGKVFQSLVAVTYEPSRTPLSARASFGRFTGDARGVVALWPFDPLAALAGTRRVAISTGSLDHVALAVDRDRPARSGLDGGLAVCRVAPRARYETWQATVLGLGHDDASSGHSTLRAAWLLGARLAATLEGFGARARVEAAQWIPVRIERERRHVAGGDGDGGGDGAGGSDSGGGERGGTVLRVSIESQR